MRPRLLIIDDQPTIHQDFRAILSNTDKHNDLSELEQELFGADIQTSTKEGLGIQLDLDSAYKGEQAIEMCRTAVRAAQPYFMAFVDVRMPPGIDGIETLEQLWKIDPSLEAVLCTAYSDYTWSELQERLGAPDNLLILRKPVEAVQIRQLVAAVLHRHRRGVEAREHLAQARADIGQLQQSFAAYHQGLEYFVDTMRDPIFVLARDGELIRANDAAKSHFGMDHGRWNQALTTAKQALAHSLGQSQAGIRSEHLIAPHRYQVHIVPFLAPTPTAPWPTSADNPSSAPPQSIFVCVYQLE